LALQIFPIDRCRSAFDELHGPGIDWPASSPGEAERAEKQPVDDDVPL
jgi:hypothetical protein